MLLLLKSIVKFFKEKCKCFMLKCYSFIPEALFRQDDMFNVNWKSVDDDRKTMWSSVARIQTMRFSTSK